MRGLSRETSSRSYPLAASARAYSAPSPREAPVIIANGRRSSEASTSPSLCGDNNLDRPPRSSRALDHSSNRAYKQ